MKASIDRNTGLLIESQSTSTDETMLQNASLAGFNNVEIRIVTDTELSALIETRDLSKMSQQDKFLAIEKALDKHIDAVAEAHGYGRVGLPPSAACLGYAAYANTWQAEAIKYGQWIANCWQYTIQEQAKILAGTRTIPTPAQAISELPIMVW